MPNNFDDNIQIEHNMIEFIEKHELPTQSMSIQFMHIFYNSALASFNSGYITPSDDVMSVI